MEILDKGTAKGAAAIAPVGVRGNRRHSDLAPAAYPQPDTVDNEAPTFERDHILDSSMYAIFVMDLLSAHD